MYPTAVLARASLLLCLVVGSRQLSITELAVPSAVRSGESAELACRVDLGAVPAESLIVKWWWTPLNSSTTESKAIYQRIAPDPGDAVHDFKMKENDTIVLSEALPVNSGRYECEVSSLSENMSEARQHQNLIVYTPGTGPQLNISKVADGPDEDTDEDVLIECRADDVAPEPDLVLTINKKEFNVTEEVLIGPDAKGFYDAVVTVTVSKSAVDGTTVACELFYFDANITHEPYIAAEDYVSRAPTTNEVPEESTVPGVTPTFQKQSGDRTASAGWAVLVALSLLAQLPALV